MPRWLRLAGRFFCAQNPARVVQLWCSETDARPCGSVRIFAFAPLMGKPGESYRAA